VAHTYNPSYLGVIDRRISEAHWTKKHNTLPGKKKKKTKPKRPSKQVLEFNPQYG
jgi:hypothetical protein